VINISGLSIGLTLVIILLAWLQFESSFDKFHINANRIFRVVVEFEQDKSSNNFAGTAAPLGEVLKNNIPEVSDYVRFSSWGRVLVNFEKEQFWEDIELSDPSIFKIFSFKLLSGNPATALKSPGSIVISETKARKYFGNKNPIGQTLLLDVNKTPYIITGVMKDIPANSQLQFDFLGSFSEITNNLSWGEWNYSTYVLAHGGGSFKTISEKLPTVVKKIPLEEKFQLHIQPLLNIHLHSSLRYDLPTNMDMKTVYIVSSILILVLIVACINYLNLAISRYLKRGKEAGLRKVAGATNSNLFVQFLCESFAIIFSSLIIALFLSFLLMPVFVSLTHFPLDFGSFFNFNSFVKFIIIILLITIIAGSYPAFILSSVNPVSAIREDFKLGKTISVKGLLKVLVIFQFFISIVLIACTLIIHSQMNLIRNKNLGLTPDQVVVVPIYQAEVKPKYELFKKEILTSPYILNASAVAYFIGPDGYCQNSWWEGLHEGDNSYMMSLLPVDQDFINTLKIEVVKGENFPENISGDNSNAYILNESALKKTGWNDPIGKKYENGRRKGTVIGIVKDFNFKSLHSKIEPLALAYRPELFDNLMIKISTENIIGTINFLREKWESLYPNTIFEFSFLSEDFQKLYEKETMTQRIITSVSLLSLFISCIGLFGLAVFTTDRRIKEIGLRKAAGSTSGGIVIMLNLEFIKWIFISFMIACPVVIYFMKKWLESFAYRINLSWWIFALAGLITIIISLLTVSWHTWNIATKNPVDCLKHE
jgi:putative ABC transport system permease protein